MIFILDSIYCFQKVEILCLGANTSPVRLSFHLFNIFKKDRHLPATQLAVWECSVLKNRVSCLYSIYTYLVGTSALGPVHSGASHFHFLSQKINFPSRFYVKIDRLTVSYPAETPKIIVDDVHCAAAEVEVPQYNYKERRESNQEKLDSQVEGFFRFARSNVLVLVFRPPPPRLYFLQIYISRK